MSAQPPPAWIEFARRFAVGAVFASLAAGFVAVIAAIMMDGFFHSRTTSALLPLPFVGVIYGCLAMVSIYVAQRRRYERPMAISLVLYALSATVWLFTVAADSEMSSVRSDTLWTIAVTLVIPAVALSLGARLLLLPASMFVLRALIMVEVVSLGLLAAIYTPLLWIDWDPRRSLFAVGLFAWSALTLIGLAALPTMSRMPANRVRGADETIPSRLSLDLTCPSCGAEQSLPTGVTACTACRFALVIDVEEPRCECGYLLYQLRGEACPECGRGIPARDRWTPAD